MPHCGKPACVGHCYSAILDQIIVGTDIGEVLQFELRNSRLAAAPKVQIGWCDGTDERTKQTALNPKGLTIVDLSSGAAKVDIRTVLGDSFSLTVPAQRESKSTQHKLDRVREPRVQITYEVEVGGAIESREVPFVVGVMAKLSGTQTAAPPPLRDRKFVQIDSDSFDQVMESINPRLSLRMENRLDK